MAQGFHDDTSEVRPLKTVRECRDSDGFLTLDRRETNDPMRLYAPYTRLSTTLIFSTSLARATPFFFPVCDTWLGKDNLPPFYSAALHLFLLKYLGTLKSALWKKKSWSHFLD